MRAVTAVLAVVIWALMLPFGAAVWQGADRACVKFEVGRIATLAFQVASTIRRAIRSATAVPTATITLRVSSGAVIRQPIDFARARLEARGRASAVDACGLRCRLRDFPRGPEAWKL